MTELTIQISDEQYQRIASAAKNSGKSIEDIIQDLIASIPEGNHDLTKDPLYQFEGFDSDAPSDLSTNADKYLYGKTSQ